MARACIWRHPSLSSAWLPVVVDRWLLAQLGWPVRRTKAEKRLNGDWPWVAVGRKKKKGKKGKKKNKATFGEGKMWPIGN